MIFMVTFVDWQINIAKAKVQMPIQGNKKVRYSGWLVDIRVSLCFRDSHLIMTIKGLPSIVQP